MSRFFLSLGSNQIHGILIERLIYMVKIKLTFFWLLFSSFSNAQIEQIDIEAFSDFEGLIPQIVQTYFEDRFGYIWIGSYLGLTRFDGYSFANFYYHPNDANSLAGKEVYNIAEDADGDLWVVTNGGVCRYNRAYDNFTRYSFSNFNNENNSDDFVHSLEISNKNEVYFGTQHGLAQFKKESDQIEHVTTFPNLEYFKNYLPIHDIESIDNLIYAVGNYNGILIYNPAIDKTNFIPGPLTDSIPKHLCFYENMLYILDLKGNVHAFNTNGNVFTELKIDYQEIEKETCYFSDIEYKDDVLWISCNYSVYKHYLNYGRTALCAFNIKNGDKNVKLNTLDIFFGEHTYWFGGVNQPPLIGYTNKNFHEVHFLSDVSVSKKDKGIVTLTGDDKGNVWFANPKGGIYKYNPEKDKVVKYDIPVKHLNNSIMTMAYHNNRIYLGHWLHGLSVYNIAKGTVKTIDFTKHEKGEKETVLNVWDINFDDHGNIWLATMGQGVYKYNLSNNRSVHYSSTSNNKSFQISGDHIFSILSDSQGNIWIGTVKHGLNKIDAVTGDITVFVNKSDDEASLSDNSVWTLFEDSKNRLWVCTWAGLNLMNRDEGTFKKYFSEDGLANNDVRSINEDDKGNIWLGTYNGLSCLNPEEERFTNYGIGHGLTIQEFRPDDMVRDSRGYIYLGGNNGLNYFNPDSIIKVSIAPEVQITGLTFYNKPVGIGDTINDRVVLDSALSVKNFLELSYKDDFFTIEFTGLDFIAPKEIQYAFKLEGYHDKWIYTDANNRKATFTGLPAGRYTFMVKAANRDGIWTDKPRLLHVVVRPPFWSTWWFKLTFVLLVILMVSAVVRMRFRFLHEAKLKLEKEVERQTIDLRLSAKRLNDTNVLLENRQRQVEEQKEELASQNEELIRNNQELTRLNNTKNTLFSIIAHDLRNPFSSVMGLLELLKMNYEKYADEKRKHLINSALLSSQQIFGLLENLLIWARSQVHSITFSRERINFCQLLSDNFDLLGTQADKKGVQLKNKVNVDVELFADRNMLNTITRNLLSNAIKYTSNGSVEVAFEEESNWQIIKFQDTGVGIKAENIEGLFDVKKDKSMRGTNNESGTGLGLIICKEFVEYHQGEISVESTPGEGSVFIVKFPLE